jgi:hypothetical protein
MTPRSGDDYCYLTTTGRRSGRSADWVKNIAEDPAVTVEVDGANRPARDRVIVDDDESDLARSLVFAKYAPRSDGDLTDWRQRALPVALDLSC